MVGSNVNHVHAHPLSHTATFAFNIQMTFKILLSLFSRLSSFGQRFYPEVLCYRKRAHTLACIYRIHTFYDIVLLVSFACFMTTVEKLSRRGRSRTRKFPFWVLLFHLNFFIIFGEWTHRRWIHTFFYKNFASSIRGWEIVKVFCFCNKN